MIKHLLRDPFHIMLAVDGSDHALAAAQLINTLPLPPRSQVTLVGVLAPKRSPRQSALLAACAELQTILERSELIVKSGLLHGHPAEELASFADMIRPDLIMVGAKGLHARLGILLGGIAQQVVEHAKWPVLVVRSPYTAIRRVLFVSDGSSDCRQAAGYLVKFPLPLEVEVSVMHVLPSQLSMDFHPPGSLVAARPVITQPSVEDQDVLANQAEAEGREGKAILSEAIEILKSAGFETQGILSRGEAAGEIIDYARGSEIDLIVAGSRGLSAVKGWLLGSVSRKLVHYAGCSVLIVRDHSEYLTE